MTKRTNFSILNSQFSIPPRCVIINLMLNKAVNLHNNLLENLHPGATERVILEIKTTRTDEETPEAMVQFLASLTNIKRQLFPFWSQGVPISFEIAVIEQMIHFYVTVASDYQSFIESQLVSQYPKALMVKTKDDYMKEITKNDSTLSVGQMKLLHGSFYPIRTYSDFKDVDPLSSLLGFLSKSQEGDKIAIQFMLHPVNKSWQRKGEQSAGSKQTTLTGAEASNPYSKVIMDKIAVDGFKTAIRIAVNSESKTRSTHIIRQIGNSFSSFHNPSGNGLIFKKVFLWQKNRLVDAMLHRSRFFMPRQILNIHEIATMFHFPTQELATINNISWHKAILSEPPEKLPVAEGMTEEEKKDTNFFARTMFRNKMMTFGIKPDDRRRHMYIIGKTGTGKSTLVANLAINDIRNGKGLCIVDPHGDLCETILDYIPSYRINVVIYLDPSDLDLAFSFNPLQVDNDYQRELVVSGIIAIFQKIYGMSWGPRLEYILRMCLLTLTQLPEPTMLMVPELLINDEFRKKIMKHVTDPVLISFWEGEFANMNPRLKSEAISPILNKVGQFISSRFIRNILQHHKSTIDLEKIMNEGKIILLNLSQGKLGEDNSALLGAMIISKIQLSAMNRVSIAEEDRRDFYLYVDEFQNFATSSFIKILSEARKYRLNLILANQYISQIPEDVRGAIFGNTGTMFSFLVGATDASFMAKEFVERFEDKDLLSLGNYQAIIKIAIDNMTQAPFLCYTLPLPRNATQNREKVIKNSRMRYMKPVEN